MGYITDKNKSVNGKQIKAISAGPKNARIRQIIASPERVIRTDRLSKIFKRISLIISPKFINPQKSEMVAASNIFGSMP